MADYERIVRVIVSGRVQGVGFRAWTQSAALSRAVTGWVRNRPDGTVEAVFAGSAVAIAALCEECRRGPPSAHVRRLDIVEADQDALSEAGGGRIALDEVW